jgi:hypothetical protein
MENLGELFEIAMNNIDQLLDRFVGVIPLRIKLSGAQLVFHEVRHQTIHCAACGRYSLKQHAAVRVRAQGAFNARNLPLNASKTSSDALVAPCRSVQYSSPVLHDCFDDGPT